MSHMMDSPHPAKIVFPAPPPTRNSLTAQQRMQLMRSTKKLGRIFGTTPHLIDTTDIDAMVPLHISLPLNELDKRQSVKSYQRASMDSISSKSSMTSISSSSASFESSASSSPALSHSGSRRSSRSSMSSSSSSNSSPSVEPWSLNRKNKPPMLRLAVASPLETIPASPITTDAPVFTHRRSFSIDGYPVPPPARYQYELQPSMSPSPSPPQSSPSSPTFNIPSASSERRMKMERLRRKLGEDVPLEMVFPPAQNSDSDDLGTTITLSNSSSTTESPITTPGSSPVSSRSFELHEKCLLPPPTLAPTLRRRKPGNRIANSRDSILLESSQRARRTFIAPKASRPAPPPPAHSPKAKEAKKVVQKDAKKEVTHIRHERFSYVVISEDRRHSLDTEELEQETELEWKMETEKERETGRLGVIPERPDEEFSMGAMAERCGSGDESMTSLGFDSEWYASDEEERETEELDEDVMWKRRSGYGSGAWAWAGLGDANGRSPCRRLSD